MAWLHGSVELNIIAKYLLYVYRLCCCVKDTLL